MICVWYGDMLEKMISIARENGGLYYFENGDCRDKEATIAENTNKRDFVIFLFIFWAYNFPWTKQYFKVN